jgi:hypothetical protein
VIDVSGLLFGSFDIPTPIATVVYYGRRVLTSVWDALILGILPVLAAGSSAGSSRSRCRAHPRRRSGRWWESPCSSVVLMFAARFILRSPFFHIQRESDGQRVTGQHTGSHRR